MPSIEDHARRYALLTQQRQLFDTEMQDIVELIVPFADDVTMRRTPGSTRTDRLYDMTAVLANEELAASLLGDMSSPSVEWHKFGFRNAQFGQDYESKAWIQHEGDAQLRDYGASNFYEAVQLFHMLRQAQGTAAMFIGEAESAIDPRITNLRFKVLPFGQYVIAENQHGIVDTLYHTRMFTPRQAVQKYRVVPDIIRRNYGNPEKVDVPMAFVQCVYPREDRDPWKVTNTHFPFADVTYIDETKEKVEEKGFHEFPFVVSRWATMGSSPYGYGLGHLALPEARTLQALKEMNLQALVMQVLPPLQALREGVIGNISLESLAVNWVSQPNAISALRFEGRPDLVQIDQAQLQASLKSIFYNDILSAIPPPDVTQMTAYEVAQRVEQRVRRIGPAFHRLTSEMFDRLADRVFGLRWRRGQVARPPLAVLLAAQQNAGQIDVEYTGVLARAQKGADIRAMHEVVQFTGSIAELTQDPSIWDVLLLPDFVRHYSQVNGLPSTLVRDIFQVKKRQEAREQQQQAQMQAAEVRANMESVGKVTPFLTAMRDGQQGQAA